MKSQKRKGNDQKDMAFRMHSIISKQDIPKVQKDNYRHPPKFEKNSQKRELLDQKQITFGMRPNMSRQEMSKQLKKQ